MELLLILGAATALVYGAVVFLRGGLIAGGVTVLVAGICFGHPLFHLGMITSDRVLWAVLMVQFVIWQRLARTEPKSPGWPELILIAFTAVLVGCTFTHDWQTSNAMPVARLAFLYFLPLGMYWVAWQARVEARALTYLYAGMWAFALYLAVTAIAETHELPALVQPAYIASSAFDEFLGRGRGPLLNPAGNGILMGTCLAGALMLWPQLNRAGRTLLALSVPVVLAGVYCTLTRSAWIGASLGLLLVVAAGLSPRWRVLLLAGAVIGGLLVGVTQWERIMSFKRDRALDASEAAESAKLRPILAEIAWRMFLDRPAFGCGLGQYLNEHTKYLGDRDSDLPLERGRPYVQHNVVLSLLTEAGLAGAGLFVILLGLWIRAAWQLWTAPSAPLAARQLGLLFIALVINYLANGMFQDVSIIQMVHMVLFFLAGLTANFHQQWAPATLPVATTAVPSLRLQRMGL